MENREALVASKHLETEMFGPIRVKQLMEHFGEASAICPLPKAVASGPQYWRGDRRCNFYVGKKCGSLGRVEAY
jgi:hypothetical protein